MRGAIAGVLSAASGKAAGRREDWRGTGLFEADNAAGGVDSRPDRRLILRRALEEVRWRDHDSPAVAGPAGDRLRRRGDRLGPLDAPTPTSVAAHDRG